MKFRIIGYYILAVITVITILLLYFFSFFNMLNRLGYISESNLIRFTVSFSSVFSIIVIVYLIILLRKKSRNRFDNWLTMSFSRIVLYYLISIICFISIRKDIMFTYEDLCNIISLEWTILGISIAIFLVWSVIIIDYLEKKKPTEIDKGSLFERLLYILYKTEYNLDTTLALNPFVLLFINLIVLIIATFGVYFYGKTHTLFVQNIAIISFYFSTNTIIELFLNYLTPLYKKQKKLIKDSKVTQAEVEERNRIIYKTNKIYDAIDCLKSIDSLDENAKKELLNKLLEEIFASKHE